MSDINYSLSEPIVALINRNLKALIDQGSTDMKTFSQALWTFGNMLSRQKVTSDEEKSALYDKFNETVVGQTLLIECIYEFLRNFTVVEQEVLDVIQWVMKPVTQVKLLSDERLCRIRSILQILLAANQNKIEERTKTIDSIKCIAENYVRQLPLFFQGQTFISYMMDGLSSMDAKYAKTCLMAVSSLTATED